MRHKTILLGVFLILLLNLNWAETAAASGSLMEGTLYDDTMLRLEGEIKNCVKKQAIYAHNIANKDVPGYKPIRFEDELAELREQPDFNLENDKVSVEDEMSKMTKNRFKHQTYLRLYNLKLQTLKKVVSQGKG